MWRSSYALLSPGAEEWGHMSFPLPRELRALTPRVHGWLPDGHATWGLANCVLVAGADTALLVDTPYTADMTRHLQRLAAEVLAPGIGIDTVINTHGNGDHSYGNGLFRTAEPREPERPGAAEPGAAEAEPGAADRGAEIIGTEANSVHLCAEPSPAELAGLIALVDPGDPFGAYVTRHFGRFGDFGGLETVPPTRTFSGELTLDVGGVAVRLIEVGPAHTAGDLIVHLPDEGVVCAGDVVFNEDHPVHWAGPLEQVHRACLRILECEPRVVVPGHGPLMTAAEVRTYADYLLALRDRIHEGHAAGRALTEVAAGLVATNPYPRWGMPERMAILAAVEYRALDGDEAPPNLIQLVGLAAGFATADPATTEEAATAGAGLEGAAREGARSAE